MDGSDGGGDGGGGGCGEFAEKDEEEKEGDDHAHCLESSAHSPRVYKNNTFIR